MPKFKYKVRELSGQVTEGETEAVDRFALAADMRSAGKTIITVDEVKKGDIQALAFIDNILNRVKTDDLIIFCNNISAMMKAGLSLTRTLSILERQAKKEPFKKAIHAITEEISKGNTLSGGMATFPKIFSPLLVSMVRAGEESGNLAEAFSIVGSQLEKSNSLKKKIKGAMIYPSVVVSALVIIGILMFIYVVPTLAKTFIEMKVELPTSTKIVIGISDFLANHYILGLVMFISLVAGFIVLLRTKKGRYYFEYSLFYIPFVKMLVRESNAARTARTLSSLLSSGVDMLQSLAITRDVMQNSFFKEVIADAERRVQKGTPLSAAFVEHDKVYPMLVGEMIEVGEETGNLPQMLLNVATYYENEVDSATKNMTTIIEPVLMVFIGGSVGFFAVSMITPMYSVMSGV